MTWTAGETAIICRRGYRAVEASVIEVIDGTVRVRRCSREYVFDADTGLGEHGHLITQQEQHRAQKALADMEKLVSEKGNGWRK